MEFSTSRLRCCLLQPEDKANYCSLYTDPKVMRKIAKPLSQKQAESSFEKTLSNLNKRPFKQLTWAIFHQNSFWGIQGLTWHGKHGIAEIGIMLNQPSAGKGIPYEAMGALVDYGFTHLNLENIFAHFHLTNKAVERFIKKLGFLIQQAPTELNDQLSKYANIERLTWLHSANRVIAQIAK